MDRILDWLAGWLNLDGIVNLFSDHEEFIMTKGLRIVAWGCIIVAVAYAVQAFFQFRNM